MNNLIAHSSADDKYSNLLIEWLVILSDIQEN